MKVLLVHFRSRTEPAAAVALAHLAAHALRDPEIRARTVVATLEFDVGDDVEDVLERLYAEAPQVVLLYADHRNATEVGAAADGLRKILPAVRILACGPEASWGGDRLLAEQPSIDVAFRNEAEEAFCELLLHYLGTGTASLRPIDGITFRSVEGPVVVNKNRAPRDPLDELASPFADPLVRRSPGGLRFLETARGFAGTVHFDPEGLGGGALRAYPVARVARDLDLLLAAHPPSLRFTDAPFNLVPERACEILAHLASRLSALPERLPVALELAVEPLDSATLGLLDRIAPVSVDVRLNTSVDEGPASVVSRLEDPAFRRGLEALCRGGSREVALHVTYGLPDDDHALFQRWVDFAVSFERCALLLHPACLAKGTTLHRTADESLVANPRAPRALLKGARYSYEDVVRSARTAEAVRHWFANGPAGTSLLLARCRDAGVRPAEALDELGARLVRLAGERDRDAESALARALDAVRLSAVRVRAPRAPSAALPHAG
ncbi:MAG: cobalamin-dependent protein [Vicinamibacteria bacterium]